MQLLQSQSDLAGNNKFYLGDEKVLEHSVRKWSTATVLIVQGTRQNITEKTAYCELAGSKSEISPQ